MGKLYLILAISFLVLFIAHVVFAAINVYFWAINGLEALLQGMNFIEIIYFSIYLKWILLADGIWWAFTLSFLLKRKHYKTDPSLHYFTSKPIHNPNVCIVLPTFNEELSIEKMISGFKNQQNVNQIIVVDNHSSDRTAEIAELNGAKVIRKDSNKGYSHSCLIGFKESLKTDANIVVLTDSDGTFDARDIVKMIPYLDNSDMVIGSRQVQILTEKGNQNSMFYVWGNFFLAKILQMKYFSLLHMGILQLTDVGCSYRCIRRDALEKILDKITYSESVKTILDSKSWLFTLFMTMIGIESDLKIVEVPVTFKKRIGISKSKASKKNHGIIYGFRFLWYIISR